MSICIITEFTIQKLVSDRSEFNWSGSTSEILHCHWPIMTNLLFRFLCLSATCISAIDRLNMPPTRSNPSNQDLSLEIKTRRYHMNHEDLLYPFYCSYLDIPKYKLLTTPCPPRISTIHNLRTPPNNPLPLFQKRLRQLPIPNIPRLPPDQ